MSTVMSKLRDLSDRMGVPYPLMTKTVSGAIITLYLAKLTYPIVDHYLHPKQSDPKTEQFSGKISSPELLKSSVVGQRDDTLNGTTISSITICDSDLEYEDDDEDDLDTIAIDRNGAMAESCASNASDTLIRLINSNRKHYHCDEDSAYLNFGPKRSQKILAKLEELLVKFLLRIRSYTSINVSFVVQMIKLIRIMVPKVASLEVLLLIIHTISLISRTFLSIFVANLEGRVVKYIVRRDLQQFSYSMLRWILISLPATFLNSLIRFLESKLALAFRSRLVSYAYGLYFQNETYYSVSNLDGRLENADHSLTDDITTFAKHCAHMYSHVTKPLLDVAVVLFTLFHMGRQQGSTGLHGPALGTTIVFCTHLILRRCSPQFGKLVSEESRRKGFLRSVHSRVISNAEEIAFYRGGHIERSVLNQAYRSLIKQSNLIFKQRLWYVMLEQLLMKYLWSATGLVVIATPIMLSGKRNRTNLIEDISERTEYMMTSKNILISGSDAMERLLSSYKELTELVGYCERVAKMFTVFEEVGRGEFKRESHVKRGNKFSSTTMIVYDHNGMPKICGETVIVNDHIRLIDVPIVTPNCDIVVPSLTIKIIPNMHLLITGPNGCGKSSLFRILASLWPLFSGRLERPQTKEMFYIPQRPYMSLGTLRDQLIYPDSIKMMRKKGLTDSDLESILEKVHLKHIVHREGGWNVRRDWKDILSGGEKQRMGMARLFYHRPKFALLDECTSAVSIDVEAKMYETAKELGITLITITHRPSLWRFHTHILRFNGNGEWSLEKFDTNDKRLSLQEEKEKLEKSLTEVTLKQARLNEIRLLLNEEIKEIIDEESVIVSDRKLDISQISFTPESSTSTVSSLTSSPSTLSSSSPSSS
ncbi:ATP-binding cassette sub-family D member 2 [Sarcoptes scabiei]|uniref:ATP-binding cassette sub-family D member 2 n=1 Tax=Sarcoptes scabiei TaxID=52283 RepID=A0A834VBW9_SARSC|nr:ATP-binding cassette sub-family D member 2 [Sarcoptes scabiei]